MNVPNNSRSYYLYFKTRKERFFLKCPLESVKLKKNEQGLLYLYEAADTKNILWVPCKEIIKMKKQQKLDLIEELTTHKNDFKVWPIIPTNAKSDLRSDEPVTPQRPPYIRIDPQSHAPYSPSVHVPFDLYFKPKPIVGTDPRECFTEKKWSQTKLSGENRELSTLLSPTLPLWEIESENELRTILNYTYTGMHKLLMEEAALSVNNKKGKYSPNRVVAEGNDLSFKPPLYPPLPPGWISAARHWDSLQIRSLGDPFRTFWTRRGPEVECGCCCNPLPNMLPQETKDEIDRLICEDKLRLAYDVTKTNYGGYRPICAKGVPLGKK